MGLRIQHFLSCKNRHGQSTLPRGAGRWLRRALRGIVTSCDGVALTEAAIVTPFLIVIIIGTVDTARYGTARLQIQQAINRGLELSSMGGPSLASTDIQAQVALQANVPTSAITVTRTLECAGVATTWSGTCTSGQETARYTRIDIATTFTPTFVFGSFARAFGNADAVVPVSVTGAIRIQ
jgi:Flp pilus assembly protein TadG